MSEDLNREYLNQYIVDDERERSESDELDDDDLAFLDDRKFPFYPQGFESSAESKVIDLTQEKDEIPRPEDFYLDLDEDVDVDDHAFNIEEKKDWPAEYPAERKRYYRYCLTVWAIDAFPSVEDLFVYLKEEKGEPLKYIVGQTEVAPTTGNKHLQVYLEWHNAKSFGAMRRLLVRTWIGVPNGTAAENKAYCTKPDTAVRGSSFEWGMPGEEAQGRRSDLKDFCDMVINAPNRNSLREIIMSNPMAYVRNHRGIEKLNSLNWKSARTEPYVCYVYGEPGVGKSTAVRRMEPFLYFKRDGPWWDNYTGQPAVLIDEFHIQSATTPLYEFLQTASGIPHMQPTKGGHTDLTFDKLYLVSHLPFDTILERNASWCAAFAYDPSQRLAVTRRVHASVEITLTKDASGNISRTAVAKRLNDTMVPADWMANWSNSGLTSITWDGTGAGGNWPGQL